LRSNLITNYLIMNYQPIYTFAPYAPDIYADTKGNFFSIATNRPVNKSLNNGAICVSFGGNRYGLKKLRRYAVKSKLEINNCPF